MTEQGFVEIGEPRMTRLLMSRDIGNVHVEIMLEVEDLSSKIDVSKLLRDCLTATEEAIEEVNKRFFDEFAADQWRKERL
uniref:Uncharacterized protein n=1 Tax=viral metagenome TaxID=1070528 RepID=A0A6M3M6T7_9ZZZZ